MRIEDEGNGQFTIIKVESEGRSKRKRCTRVPSLSWLVRVFRLGCGAVPRLLGGPSTLDLAIRAVDYLNPLDGYRLWSF